MKNHINPLTFKVAGFEWGQTFLVEFCCRFIYKKRRVYS